MAFPKGQSGNPSGRPRGLKNKPKPTPEEVAKELLLKIVNDEEASMRLRYDAAKTLLNSKQPEMQDAG